MEFQCTDVFDNESSMELYILLKIELMAFIIKSILILLGHMISLVYSLLDSIYIYWIRDNILRSTRFFILMMQKQFSFIVMTICVGVYDILTID